MLDKNTKYNITVGTDLKLFHNVEFEILQDNTNTTGLTVSGNIIFTLKPTTDKELESLFNKLYGVPQRQVKITLTLKEKQYFQELLIIGCDDKIPTDYLTINGEII